MAVGGGKNSGHRGGDEAENKNRQHQFRQSKAIPVFHINPCT
jgi:hypothetical protein